MNTRARSARENFFDLGVEKGSKTVLFRYTTRRGSTTRRSILPVAILPVAKGSKIPRARSARENFFDLGSKKGRKQWVFAYYPSLYYPSLYYPSLYYPPHYYPSLYTTRRSILPVALYYPSLKEAIEYLTFLFSGQKTVSPQRNPPLRALLWGNRFTPMNHALSLK